MRDFFAIFPVHDGYELSGCEGEGLDARYFKVEVMHFRRELLPLKQSGFQREPLFIG